MQKAKLIAVLLVVLALGANADVDNWDTKKYYADYFDVVALGGFLWGDLVGSELNYVNVTNADGTFGAIAWHTSYPKLVIAKFSAANRSAHTMVSRTGFAFYGAHSLGGYFIQSEYGIFDFNKWTLTVTDKTLTGGVSVKNLTYTNQYSVHDQVVTMRVEDLIVLTGGSVSVNGVAYTATAGTVKSTYWVDNWPFTGPNDRLLAALVVDSSGKGVANSSTISIGSRFGVGSGFIGLPQTCTVDGTSGQNVNITAVVINDGSDGGDEVMDIVIFEFPKFNSTLEYDPVNSLTYSSGAYHVAVAGVSMLMLIALALLALV